MPLTLSSHLAVLQHADNESMDTTTRPLLTLVCPACGSTFPSAMKMDPRTFEGIRVTNLFERCPKCSRVSRFNKADYLFRAPGETEINLRSGRARWTAVAPKG